MALAGLGNGTFRDMSTMDIDGRLRAVFSAVFGIDGSTLDDTDSPNTIAGWDSVNHLNLMLSLEAEFGVEFDVEELATLTSLAAIRRRLSIMADGQRQPD